MRAAEKSWRALCYRAGDLSLFPGVGGYERGEYRLHVIKFTVQIHSLAVGIQFDVGSQYTIVLKWTYALRHLLDNLSALKIKPKFTPCGGFIIQLGGEQHEHWFTRGNVQQILTAVSVSAKTHGILTGDKIQRRFEHIFLIFIIGPVIGVGVTV